MLLVAVFGAGALGQAAVATAQEGTIASGVDRTIRPGDDFFAFANNDWLNRHDIPADEASVGTFSQLANLTEARTLELIEHAAVAATPGSEAQKIGDLYASFMDEATIEAKGIEPVKRELDDIGRIEDRRALSGFLGSLLRTDVDTFSNFDTDTLFGLSIASDFDDPGSYSPFLLQGGLGLLSRDYYLDPSPHAGEIRARYVAHIAALLRLANIPDVDAKAAAIFALETRIAGAQDPRVDSQNVHKGNNHWTRSDFETRASGLDWDAFFAAAGLAGQRRFVVWQPSAVAAISQLVQGAPLSTWREYLTFHTLDQSARVLPKAFADESFAFWSGIWGLERQRERSKRAAYLTNALLGDAVGKLYVARYFPASEKARAETLVKNLIAAFALRIDKLEWMAAGTKAAAKAKLATVYVGVGYPEHWRDYAALEIQRDDVVGNIRRARLFRYKDDLVKLGKRVDRTEWQMAPQTVNAENLPAMNALNFPAGILQPPFFDSTRPLVMDYGAIGAIIGHEISHGFDSVGAEFDSTGRLANWWTPEDHEHFETSGKLLVAQFDAYRPFPDLAINGQQTLAENIADAAGLATAYDAYHLSLDGRPAPVIDGLTGDQQFFLAYAGNWRDKEREAAERDLIVSDDHAPSKYRTWAVRNIDAWYAAFQVEPDQAMFVPPALRAHIW